MTLGYTMSPETGGNDLLLSGLAGDLAARGLTLAGLVQENRPREDEAPCDMLTKVLPSGRVYQISQSLGRHARGCRLDPQALEMAVGEVMEVLERDTPDLVIVNKFGKHEAAGRGMRPVIEAAMIRGIPVIVGVNHLNTSAFTEYVAGGGVEVAPNREALLDWALAAAGQGAAA